MVSKSTVIRLFKKHFNVTPKQYIKDTKIAVAKDLLFSTRMSISEIAEYLAFSHQNNFSQAFSNATGVSPTIYRQEHPYTVGERDDLLGKLTND